VFTRTRSKIGIIALSVILLTGIVFVPVKQIKGQGIQATTSSSSSSINQRATQIPQIIANSNPTANKLAISQVILAIYTQIASSSGQAKASQAITEINSYVSAFPKGHVSQALLCLGNLQAAQNTASVARVESLIAQKVRAGGSAAAALVAATPCVCQTAAASAYVNSQLNTLAQKISVSTGRSQVVIRQLLQQDALQSRLLGGGAQGVQNFITNIVNLVAVNVKEAGDRIINRDRTIIVVKPQFPPCIPGKDIGPCIITTPPPPTQTPTQTPTPTKTTFTPTKTKTFNPNTLVQGGGLATATKTQPPFTGYGGAQSPLIASSPTPTEGPPGTTTEGPPGTTTEGPPGTTTEGPPGNQLVAPPEGVPPPGTEGPPPSAIGGGENPPGTTGGGENPPGTTGGGENPSEEKSGGGKSDGGGKGGGGGD
jgi:hypothetical protein